MKKNNIGDLVAKSMFDVLNSDEHTRLFKTSYASAPAAAHAAGGSAHMKAEDANAAKSSCQKCMMAMDKCSCGYADDNSSWKADDQNDAKVKQCKQCDKFVGKDGKCKDCDAVSDHVMKSSAAYDTAVENLLTASAALDYAGFEKGSELVLKLAALVVEAKKGGKKVTKKEESSASAKKEESVSSSKKEEKSSASTSSKKEEASTGKKQTSEAKRMEALRKLKGGKKPAAPAKSSK